MSELTLVKSELFENVQCDFYSDDKEIWMTRKQIGEALEYADPQKAIDKIHQRNKERLDKFSVTVKLGGTDGKMYDTTLYNAKGIYEICRWSRQPKADAFFDWVYDVLEELRKGSIQLAPTEQEKSPLFRAKILLEIVGQSGHLFSKRIMQSILYEVSEITERYADAFVATESPQGIGLIQSFHTTNNNQYPKMLKAKQVRELLAKKKPMGYRQFYRWMKKIEESKNPPFRLMRVRGRYKIPRDSFLAWFEEQQ